MRDKSFLVFVVDDLLGGIPNITSKPLFSGWGIYQDDVIFALALSGALYFKVGESNIDDFKNRESHPFTYKTKLGEKTLNSYWLVPEEILENREELYNWVDRSVEVARES